VTTLLLLLLLLLLRVTTLLLLLLLLLLLRVTSPLSSALATLSSALATLSSALATLSSALATATMRAFIRLANTKTGHSLQHGPARRTHRKIVDAARQFGQARHIN
jgi:hypothetical protein